MNAARFGRRSPGVLQIVTVAAITLILGCATGWAAATIFVPPSDVVATSEFTIAQVAEGEVEASISLNAVAQWQPSPIGTNLAAGSVTSVNVANGSTVTAGTVLYTVNLRPVTVAVGEFPAFRDLRSGDSGADVAQLKSFLRESGNLSGSTSDRFDASTVRAVQAWQRSQGVTADGVVMAGDMIFVPSLPVPVVLDTAKVARGMVLVGGEAILQGLLAEPSFSIPLSDAQTSVLTAGTRVVITSPGGDEWTAFIDEQIAGEDGTLNAILRGEDGGVICADSCADLDASGKTILAARIVTVEPASGPLVPAAAIKSRADGTTVVVSRSGEVVPISVVRTANGMSVVDGLEVGDEIRVPAIEDDK